MIIGNCPYEDCGEPLMHEIPDGLKLPNCQPVNCEKCERRIWYKISRLFPEAWTEAAFLEKFEVDEKAKTVREKHPNLALEKMFSQFSGPFDLDKTMAEAEAEYLRNPMVSFEICSNPDFPDSTTMFEKRTFKDGTVQLSLYCGGTGPGIGIFVDSPKPSA